MVRQRQCHGETKKGERCQRRGRDFFCHQHKDQEVEFVERLGMGTAAAFKPFSSTVLPANMKSVFPDYSAMFKNMFPDYSAMLRTAMPDYGAVLRTYLPILDVSAAMRQSLAPLHETLRLTALNKQLIDVATLPANVLSAQFAHRSRSLSTRTVMASLAPTFETLRQLHESGALGHALKEANPDELEATQERIVELVAEDSPEHLALRLAKDSKVTTHALMICCLAALILVATNPGVQNIAAVYLAHLLTALDKRVRDVDQNGVDHRETDEPS